MNQRLSKYVRSKRRNEIPGVTGGNERVTGGTDESADGSLLALPVNHD